MSAVTNQPPYTKLEPVPIPSERYVGLRNLAIRVMMIVTVTTLFTVFGYGLSLSALAISIEDSILLSSAVGVISSIALVYLWNLPTPLGEYRMTTLGQLEKVIGSDRGLRALSELKSFFAFPFKKFYQTFHNHALHSLLYTVSEQIPSDRPDVKKVWEVFLNHFKGLKIRNADDEPLQLDFGMELARMEGPTSLPLTVEKLSSWNFDYDDDLAQIEELQKVSLGRIGVFSKDRLKAELAKGGNTGCIVARRTDSRQVIAFAWYTENPDKSITLAGIAKDPGATGHLNIGGRLMQAFLEQMPKNRVVNLHVRKSNPAMQLYQSWGFVPIKEEPQYYLSGPPENAILMQLDWNKYNEVLQKAANRQ